MKAYILIPFIVFFGTYAAGQPVNHNCAGAVQVCFGDTVKGGNRGAGADTTWGSSCHNNINNIWFSFTTNSNGGNVSVNIEAECKDVWVSGTLLAAPAGCDPASYTEIDCNSGAQGAISLQGINLPPLTRYYILLNSEKGGQPADCEFGVFVDGAGLAYSATTSIEHAVCFEKPGTVNVIDVVMGPGPYSYTARDGSPQNSGTFGNRKVGTDTIIVKDANGCGHHVPFFVNGLNNILTVDAGEDKTIASGGSLQLFAHGNGAFYLWSPSEGLNDPASQAPIASPAGTQTYLVYTFSPEHCFASDTVTVFVLHPIIIPNAFTPNGDGTNDTWHIPSLAGFPGCTVDIYNRWGQKVFHSIGYELHQEWDGKHLGVDVPAATYYYIIDVNLSQGDKKEEIFKGAVTIIR